MTTTSDDGRVRSLRFLITDACNLRCAFCHNEFQGDVNKRIPHRWDPVLLQHLLNSFGEQGHYLRMKFSGGEPMLQWQELTLLLELTEGFRAPGATIFTNLTLASEARLKYLYSCGVSRINANLPSFQSDVFAARTGMRRSRLDLVLENARIARSLGARLQFNLVVPRFEDPVKMRNFLESELREAREQTDAWDVLSLVADDWLAAPTSVHDAIAELLGNYPDVQEETERYTPRSRGFNWAGKRLLATRCTDWSMPEEINEADLYVVPPGHVLSAYVRGRAYR
jgi:organic radical activating enzyme